MYATPKTPFTNFIPEADIPAFQPISPKANHLQGYTVTLTEGSGNEWTIPMHSGGPITTSNMHGSPHAYNTSQHVPGLQVDMQDFPALLEPTCGLAGGLPCTLPVEGSVKSIKWHCGIHGHKHPQRQVVQCPFGGCPSTLQWMNMPRHIQSRHLGIRFRCPNCDKPYTRLEGLKMHTASLKCYGSRPAPVG
ncbi:hypothetical protein OG21DRAFT_934124 [Imleria badia]|nr:hypothetical protein OG21DRAFT_934124 [Imleria badia]